MYEPKEGAVNNWTKAARWMLALVMAIMSFSFAAAQQAAGDPNSGVVVLDTTGFWQMHHTLKAPVIQLDSGPKAMDLRWVKDKRLLKTLRWASCETPTAADDWMQAEFDDTTWLRGPARMSCRTPLLSRLCMRGRFTVTDPSKVKDLQLSVAYRGGVIVYLNGKEVARHHLPQDVAGKELLASGYPAEAFMPVAGSKRPAFRALPLEAAEKIAIRRRSADIAIPSGLLRKGVNVLGLDIVRAPYHKVVEETKGTRGSRYCPYSPGFNTCQIDLVQLKAASGEGLISNAMRPSGLQVWNNNMLGADFDLDFGDPGWLFPIRMVGARNGVFSGKVVVGSTKPIRGLGATASDLTGGGMTIPASAVRIRYGIPWGREAGVNGQRTIHHSKVPEFNCYSRVPTMLGALAEKPLAEFPVRTVKPGRHDLKTPGQVAPVSGAVVPVWVTINVPGDVPAGLFKGQITIRAEGEKPRTVPVELTVTDYTLPDPQDYRTLFELIQSPDTLVREYGVERWSDEHFKLIARSMKLMREAGVHVLYVPLIAQTNHGNEESMVRWIKTGEKNYDFDFSVMKKYLDLAAKHMGKPKVVCFIAWDIYLGGTGGGYKDTWSHNQRSVNLRKKYLGKGPLVTVLDPKTRKAETVHVPPHSDPSSKATWTKLFAALRTRMAGRGWEKAMMIGLMSDDWPTKAEHQFYNEVSGDLLWVSHSHVPVTSNSLKHEGGVVTTGATSKGTAKVNRVGFRVGYHSAVLNNRYATDGPPLGSLQGWKRGDMGSYQPRYERLQPASRWRQLMELNITGEQRGVARGGADIWPSVRDRNGRRVGTVAQLYPQSAWRNLDIPWYMFAPGPTGPVSTHHFEALREGIQECQARILIEEALTDETRKQTLGADLARQCEELLVERTRFMLKASSHLQINNPWGHFTGPGSVCGQSGVNGHRWFVSSGWQDRSEKLYRLAAEVAKKLGR
jgi:Glycoside hydrolase 123, catalytic domain/Glycoside hydrolase 123, N-terminal domain